MHLIKAIAVSFFNAALNQIEMVCIKFHLIVSVEFLIYFLHFLVRVHSDVSECIICISSAALQENGLNALIEK